MTMQHYHKCQYTENEEHTRPDQRCVCSCGAVNWNGPWVIKGEEQVTLSRDVFDQLMVAATNAHSMLHAEAHDQRLQLPVTKALGDAIVEARNTYQIA